MLVKNWMSSSVISINANDSIKEAMALLRKYEIRMLPVIDNDKLVGVVTDRDVKRATGLNCVETEHLDPGFTIKKVSSIMTGDPVTVPPEYTVEDVAELLLVNKISGVPVVDNQKKVVGILTQSDLFRLWILFTGAGQKGIRMGFYVIDKRGVILKITDIIRDYGGRIESILCTHERSAKGHRRIYIRFGHVDGPSLERLIEALKEKFQVLYVID